MHAAACWPAALPVAHTRARLSYRRWLCGPQSRLSAGSRGLLHVRAATSRPAVADVELEQVADAEAVPAGVNTHSEVPQHSCVSCCI